MEIALSLKQVNKIFGERGERSLIVLKNINLEIRAGEIFVIVGPSGSGKSTFLRVINGLETSYTGEVVWNKEYRHSDIAFVFQEFALLPWLTVYQNIEVGLLNRSLSEKRRSEIVSRELHQFGLEKFAEAYPKELSGGMKQRVGLARALAIDPKILLMDEPFSELDSFTAEELRKELLRIWQERKITIIMVTHIIEEALELGDRVAVFTPRPATIEKIVDNPLPRPRDKRSKEFYEVYDTLYKLIRP